MMMFKVCASETKAQYADETAGSAPNQFQTEQPDMRSADSSKMVNDKCAENCPWRVTEGFTRVPHCCNNCGRDETDYIYIKLRRRTGL